MLLGDPFETDRNGALPYDFHEPTLTWAMERSALVVLWGSGKPYDYEPFCAMLRGAIEDSWVFLALLRSERVGEWLDFVGPTVSRLGLRCLAVGEERHLRAAGFAETLH